MADKADGPNKRPSITDQEALQFHSRGRAGKLEIVPTKPMATQSDLSLAYSPGVAVPVKAIAAMANESGQRPVRTSSLLMFDSAW